jgi:hypothetical protein
MHRAPPPRPQVSLDTSTTLRMTQMATPASSSHAGLCWKNSKVERSPTCAAPCTTGKLWLSLLLVQWRNPKTNYHRYMHRRAVSSVTRGRWPSWAWPPVSETHHGHRPPKSPPPASDQADHCVLCAGVNKDKWLIGRWRSAIDTYLRTTATILTDHSPKCSNMAATASRSGRRRRADYRPQTSPKPLSGILLPGTYRVHQFAIRTAHDLGDDATRINSSPSTAPPTLTPTTQVGGSSSMNYRSHTLRSLFCFQWPMVGSKAGIRTGGA